MVSVMENEVIKRMAYKQFTAINKKAYPILQHGAEGVLEAAHEYMGSLPVPLDFLFFDLPGTVNTPGILRTLAGMHHIFTPITADRVVMESSLVFTQLMKDVIMKRGENQIQSINLFWNQVDGRERSPLYDIYNRLIDELGLGLMQSQVTSSMRFRKENEANAKTVFRSTLLPPDERLMKACRMDQFMTEFVRTIQL